jgi:hypothetical protein
MFVHKRLSGIAQDCARQSRIVNPAGRARL